MSVQLKRPSRKKPVGQVQVKLPAGVLTQPSSQLSVFRVHSSMSAAAAATSGVVAAGAAAVQGQAVLLRHGLRQQALLYLCHC